MSLKSNNMLVEENRIVLCVFMLIIVAGCDWLLIQSIVNTVKAGAGSGLSYAAVTFAGCTSVCAIITIVKDIVKSVQKLINEASKGGKHEKINSGRW